LFHEQVAAIAAKALSRGARRLSLSHFEWDAAGDCQSPVTVERFARPSVAPTDLVRWRPIKWTPGGCPYKGGTQRAQRKSITIDGKGKVPLWVTMDVPCRKCEKCLRRKAAHWRHRAIAETAIASRTWFGTLTLRPQEQSLARERVRHRERNSVDIDLLPASERFGLQVQEIGRDITKYLKRIRANSGARFRYILVAEAHESGEPHFHMLLHEWGTRIGERELSGQWRLGFSKWRLVPPDNPKAAAYVCKYLSKSALARVRASARYGQGPLSKPRPKDHNEGVLTTPEVCINAPPVDDVVQQVRLKVKELFGEFPCLMSSDK